MVIFLSYLSVIRARTIACPTTTKLFVGDFGSGSGSKLNCAARVGSGRVGSGRDGIRRSRVRAGFGLQF